MNKELQVLKAKRFLELHHAPKLLALPNIWDPLGARLLESLGYPAVATASSSVAFSLGYDDGERITLGAMLDVIRRIASSVDVPLTADIERGYAEVPQEVAENAKLVLEAGAVGINLEDSVAEGGSLYPIDFQCERIRAVRRTAEQEGIPLVINARTDVFFGGVSGSESDKVKETIARGKAYIKAGADCFYPIMVGDLETLQQIRAETNAPINVYASASTAPMRELEDAGMSRLSLGPGLIKSSLTEMKRVAEGLLKYGPYSLFTEGAVSTSEVRRYVSKGRMS